MRKIIITQNINFQKERFEYHDSLDSRFISLLLEIGCLPYGIPNNLLLSGSTEFNKNQKLNSWINELSPDGILLTGGNDLELYKDRDQTEMSLINYAHKKKLPLLGICRGLQVIAKCS